MKTALVARLGVIGDHLIASSVLPGLKKQGYHITYAAYQPYDVIMEADPHIDKLLSWPAGKLGADKDFVEFWKRAPLLFDYTLHLSESIERTLLMTPSQMAFNWPAHALRKICGVSYLERVHDIAGVPHTYAPCFYPTAAEQEWATAIAEAMKASGGPLIGISMAGSNFDKMYQSWPAVVLKILFSEPNAKVILFGTGASKRDVALVDAVTKHVAASHGDMSRLTHSLSWHLRRSLTMSAHCDVLIGPDTGLMWGSAMRPEVRKVVLLSHASPENITKHWINTVSLTADQAKVPCWPCHKLHDHPSTCTIDPQTGGAMCITSISPGMVVEAALTETSKENADVCNDRLC